MTGNILILTKEKEYAKEMANVLRTERNIKEIDISDKLGIPYRSLKDFYDFIVIDAWFAGNVFESSVIVRRMRKNQFLGPIVAFDKNGSSDLQISLMQIAGCNFLLNKKDQIFEDLCNIVKDTNSFMPGILEQIE